MYMNTKIKKTLAIGLTALTWLRIGGTTLFAATNDNSANQKASSITAKQIGDKCKGASKFEEAVSKGIIDEATANKMVELKKITKIVLKRSR